MAVQQAILHASGNSLLNYAFMRGHHDFMSTWVCTQRPTLAPCILRAQMNGLFVFKPSNVKDLITFLDELSAMVDRRSLKAMYDQATEEKYNFLMIDLLAKDVDHMFYWNLDQRFEPSTMEQISSQTSRGIAPN